MVAACPARYARGAGGGCLDTLIVVQGDDGELLEFHGIPPVLFSRRYSVASPQCDQFLYQLYTGEVWASAFAERQPAPAKPSSELERLEQVLGRAQDAKSQG